jgi:tetratricopeptide (TPR) repeat protein
MKRRYIWFGVAAVVVLAAAISLVALPAAPEWTTASPAALEEFEAGMDAEAKLYHLEAMERFERAIELDPDFVMPKIMLIDKLRGFNEERAKALMEEAAHADLQGLTARERLYVKRVNAYIDGRSEEVATLVDEYLNTHPNDRYILKLKAGRAFGLGEYENAERLYRHLLEISPNEVIAYNQLGYVAMFQGRFSEAEEYLTSYRFIAPDQANPHDSLGELYVIQGRYDEAETSFENALAIRSDFMDTYGHLMFVHALREDFAAAQQVFDRFRTERSEFEFEVAEWECILEFWRFETNRDWQELVDRADSDCVTEHFPASYLSMAVHRAATEIGDWELAIAFEDKLEKVLEKVRNEGSPFVARELWPIFLHMQGIRLAKQGEIAEAEKNFREVDSNVVYRDSIIGWFKLFNRTLLVETMLAQGRDGEAHQLLAKVRAVNPAMAAEFEEQGLSELGLGRG